MSELQTDDLAPIEDQEIDQVETEETGTVSDGSELASDTGENQEEKTQQAQEAANKAINKKHFQYKEEERKRLAAEKELQELRAKLEQQTSQRPEIPPIPDPYDENYEAKVKARDEAIRQVVVYEAKQEVETQRKQQLEEQQRQEQAKQIESMVTTYNQRAKSLGLDVAEVEKAGDTLVQYGVSQDVANFLLSDEDGPLMTKYLAANPLELERIQSMPPMQAAIALNDSVRKQAAGLKPKQTKAPEPPEVLNGGGYQDDQGMPHIKGAKFE